MLLWLHFIAAEVKIHRRENKYVRLILLQRYLFEKKIKEISFS